MDGLLGLAGIIIDRDDWDHSRKFPTFGTSKMLGYLSLTNHDSSEVTIMGHRDFMRSIRFHQNFDGIPSEVKAL
jgi:hypothetical protein